MKSEDARPEAPPGASHAEAETRSEFAPAAPTQPGPAPAGTPATPATLRPVARTEAETHAGTPFDPNPADQLARLASWERYQVQSLLGIGGMGKVYKAWDPQLKRTVALKFLRATEPALEERFLREARAQARVDHPGVCKVYEVGKFDGTPFIALQFIDGKTLRAAAGELSLVEKVSVMRDVASAVQAAHRVSLIHRDLKPANVLLERVDGRLLSYVTDFGLVRDLREPGVTLAGQLLGTPEYMAPEQARGDQTKLDARVDVFALGATLYDLLTGVPPASGSSDYEVLFEKLNREALPASRRVPGLPRDLESVVMKAVERDPARRYASAQELADDLGRFLAGEPVRARRVGGAARVWRLALRNKPLSLALVALAAAVVALVWPRHAAGPDHVLVAVADFDNQTGESDLDGLSGLLITSLEQSRRLSVLTRSRMFDLLRQLGEPGVPRIDERLGRRIATLAHAQALVLASIRKFDARYLIDLKVLEPGSDRYLLAVREEGAGKGSVPGLIDRLSERARAGLREQTGEIEKSQGQVAAVTTTSLEAYQHYFRGQQLVDQLRLPAAREELREAVRLDPGFALAHYALGYALQWEHLAGADQELDLALQHLERIPEKERLFLQATKAVQSGDRARATALYQSCADRYPQEKECAFSLGDLAFHEGDLARALPALERAVELDPGFDRAAQHLVWACQIAGSRERMVAAAREYAAHVSSADAYAQLARALAAAGQLGPAREVALHARTLFPASPVPAADLAAFDGWEGRLDASEAGFRAILAGRAPASERLSTHLALAGVLARQGRFRAMLASLQELAGEGARAGDGAMFASASWVTALTQAAVLQKPELARATVAQARALGVPEEAFVWVYPYLADFAAFARISSADPLAGEKTRAWRARAEGRWPEAAAAFRALAEKSTYRDLYLYELGAAELAAGRSAEAAAAFERMLQTYPDVPIEGLGLGAGFWPLAKLGRATALEAQGRLDEARAALDELLALWKDADADLPQLAVARAGRERLRPR